MSDIEQKNKGENILFNDVCGIIDDARRRVAVYVNSEICLTKWYVGKRIKEDALYNQRAEYGKQIIKNLAVKLTNIYGNGWGYESLKHCLRCAETFSGNEIGTRCVPYSRQVSLSFSLFHPSSAHN